MNTPQSSIPSPDLPTTLRWLKEQIFTTFNCHQVGQVVAFSPSDQTVTVQISLLRMVPDTTIQPPAYKTIAYPLLAKVPVFIDSGGSGYLTFPIAAGDTCLVLFNDRDLDLWWSTGNTVAPNSQRCHDLSDGLALVGFRNLANALGSFDSSNAVLAYNGGKVLVSSKVQLLNASTTLTNVMSKLLAALTALNGKTGPDASAQITAFQTEYQNLLQ